MGSGASTPVYPQRIPPPSNRQYTTRRVPIGQPLQPRYKSSFEDSMTVAQQERIFRTPRHVTLKPLQHAAHQPMIVKKSPRRGTTPKAIVLNSSSAPMIMNREPPQAVIKETRLENLSVARSGQNIPSGLTTRSQSRLRADFNPQNGDENADDEFVLKTVEEFVLQDNGRYKLTKSGNCLIRSKSEILKQVDMMNHPFAPISKKPFYNTNEITRFRNNGNYRSGSSGYSSSSSTGNGITYTKKSPTGMMLNRVVKVLEAQPPQFLHIPETKKLITPSHTPVSHVGTNTAPVPPNTGESVEAPKLKHSHSSPDLYGGRRKAGSSASTVSSPLQSARPTVTSTQKWLEPPSVVKPSKYKDGFHSKCSRSKSEEELDQSTDEDEGSPDRPPHLIPSPNKRKSKKRSTTPRLLKSPSNGRASSLSVSSSRSNIKINSLGLVYI